MTYQLGVDMASRLAAITPEFGSFHRGFNLAPATGVPVMDLHGSQDTTVPANVSLSGDGYFYTTVAEIFGGNSYSKGWKSSNGCTGKAFHYPTQYDGQKKFYCVSEGTCKGGDVVRCSWQGGHNWLFNDAKSNGGLITGFLLKWAKTSHIGKGYSKGEVVGPGQLLRDIEIHNEEDLTTLASSFEEFPVTLTPENRDPHYGDPAHGCRNDEDVIPVGTGQICAP